MAKIINLTPHDINIMGEYPTTITSSGVARLTADTVNAGYLNGIPTTKTVFGEAEGLPEPESNTYLIVSQLIKSALPHRQDLLVPAQVQRDAQGRIIGCLSLGM